MVGSSETITRLEDTIKNIASGAIITIQGFEKIGTEFFTAIQQVHELEKSRDKWRARAERSEKELKQQKHLNT